MVVQAWCPTFDFLAKFAIRTQLNGLVRKIVINLPCLLLHNKCKVYVYFTKHGICRTQLHCLVYKRRSYKNIICCTLLIQLNGPILIVCMAMCQPRSGCQRHTHSLLTLLVRFHRCIILKCQNVQVVGLVPLFCYVHLNAKRQLFSHPSSSEQAVYMSCKRCVHAIHGLYGRNKINISMQVKVKKN